ncbi:hypothetical protein ABZ403_03065 [Micromonospora zamorensis]|uniref:hypothetical protein n=1 Tax=Micromonospora zamorensis TaxID=709883 RepID=UPI0033F5C114
MSRSGGDAPGGVPHDWRECRPAIVKVAFTEGADLEKHTEDDRLNAIALELVWSRLRPADKQAFHRFSCLNSRAPEDLAVVEHLSATLQAEVARLTR